MKKKILLLSTIATFALALCGCDSKKESDDTTAYSYEPVTTNASVTPDDILGSSDNNEDVTEEVADDGSVQVVEPERGTVTDGVFTNNAFKVSFPIQDDWYVCSDAEIAQILGFTTSNVEENTTLTVEQFEAATAGTVYDVVFYFSDMQSNTNITFMSLDKLGNFASLPVEDYAELSASQLDSISNVNYTVGELTHEVYGGDEYVCVNAETDQGYNQKILLKKENGHMVCVTLTYFPELEVEMQAFLDSFIEVQ